MLASWKKSYDQTRQHIKKQRHYFANKGLSSQSYRFSNSPIWMWELDYKESWALKSWCFWTVVLEKTLESPLDCKEIKPVHPKGNQSWIFIGRTDADSETPILWPPEGDSLKSPWCWKRLKAGGEGDDRGWDVWMTSLAQWTWVWVSSWSWWWTGKPDVLQSMGLQRVGHDWVTELNWCPSSSFSRLSPFHFFFFFILFALCSMALSLILRYPKKILKLLWKIFFKKYTKKYTLIFWFFFHPWRYFFWKLRFCWNGLRAV